MELLGDVLPRVCAAIPFRKSMRWGDLDATFGRPVQWMVALLGDEVVPVAFAGAKSGRESRGHRFLAPGAFAVDEPRELRRRSSASGTCSSTATSAFAR